MCSSRGDASEWRPPFFPSGRDYSWASVIALGGRRMTWLFACMGKQRVGEKHGTNITQSGYLQVVSVGVIGSSADWGGGRI